MTDLATRVEREPPSRELDAEVAVAFRVILDRDFEPSRYIVPVEYVLDERRGAGFVAAVASGTMHCSRPAPHYTTSRDAAAGLMPAGWQLRSLDCHREQWGCTLHRIGTADIVGAVAPTEPQARTAAALRAMEMERGT